MIIKWGIIGAIVGAVVGLFAGDVVVFAIFGAMGGVAFRRWIFRIFWE